MVVWFRFAMAKWFRKPYNNSAASEAEP